MLCRLYSRPGLIHRSNNLGPVHTSVISSAELATASYLRLGKPRCIDLIHTCLRPRCDDVRSRGHRKSLRLRRSIHLSGCLKSNWCEFPHTCEWVWYGDARHRTTLIHMFAGICISLSSDIQRDGAGVICGDHVNVRHRNEDGDKCVWGKYTWVSPITNTMPLGARPRKWLTCEPGLNLLYTHHSQLALSANRNFGYCRGSASWYFLNGVQFWSACLYLLLCRFLVGAARTAVGAEYPLASSV
jgi:hypothetical protein